ncbi:MAG: IPT/TIG domain-containing protein [Thermomicrobia bacterium]|nr:IPT/TIG domain-containing protein [Thermomicrobia bacterium]
MEERATRTQGTVHLARWGCITLLLIALCAVVAPGTALAAAPTVTSVSPISGPTAGGTSATISGTGFTGATAVTFGGATTASFTIVSDTQITATTPAGSAGSVDVAVTTADGTTALPNGFLYVAPPAVTGVSPNAGPIAGGQSVTITGSGFQNGATVSLGGALATAVTVTSATSLTAVTPAGTAGAVDVIVINPDAQTGTVTGGYTYVAPPTVSGVTPAAGTTAGGVSVTITGTNFTDVTDVTFGGTAATTFSVVGDTQITATAPAHAIGPVDVVVTAAGGSVTAPTTFTFMGTVPTIAQMSPPSGPAAGGASVTITGTDFAPGATVSFGGTTATNITVTSSTALTAATPAHAAGAVDVVVTNADGQSATLAGGYTFVAAPTITGISPATGSTDADELTPVTITGTGFQSGATVTFGGVVATGITVTSATITATPPAHMAGAVDVVVTNPDGQSALLTGGFTYVQAGHGPPSQGILSVRRVEPPAGSIAGGEQIVIKGTGFAAGATVTVGGAAASNVQVVNSTTINAMTPAHAAGTVDVTVSSGGKSAMLGAAYTYRAGPGRGNGGPPPGRGGGGGSHGGPPPGSAPPGRHGQGGSQPPVSGSPGQRPGNGPPHR